MTKRFPQIKEGQKLIISNGVLWDSCCDCGLVHRRVFKIEMLKFLGDKKPMPTITMRTYGAEKETRQERKNRHLFVEDKSITVGELREMYSTKNN
jgi:hypothetical protein